MKQFIAIDVMNKIVFLTATYNHASRLQQLFDSLMLQTNKSFRWLIVDDGSNDGTEKTVNEFAGLSIKYLKKTIAEKAVP